MFITFEGIDGSGKSTQAKIVTAELRQMGYDVLLTREPGGTDIGDQIRTILLDNLKNTNMAPATELLLFCASRAQLVAEVIRPSLEQGIIVLCDRYADSTMAYQGYGHQLDRKLLSQVLQFATGGLRPNLTLYLDLKPEVGLQRRRSAMLLFGEDWNRLDDMELAFHKRVYAGYERLIKAEPERWVRVPADEPTESVTQYILSALRARLPKANKARRRKRA